MLVDQALRTHVRCFLGAGLSPVDAMDADSAYLSPLRFLHFYGARRKQAVAERPGPTFVHTLLVVSLEFHLPVDLGPVDEKITFATHESSVFWDLASNAACQRNQALRQ